MDNGTHADNVQVWFPKNALIFVSSSYASLEIKEVIVLFYMYFEKKATIRAVKLSF
jgi:hypothetical protein